MGRKTLLARWTGRKIGDRVGCPEFLNYVRHGALVALSMLAKMRNAPGTPAGNSRNQE